jgi:hypothetical protein
MIQDRTPQPISRIVIKYGLIGSLIALYVSALGMVESFSLRPIVGDFLSLGYVILAGGPIGAGILTARALRDRTSRRTAIGARPEQKSRFKSCSSISLRDSPNC